ncbi:MAG: proline--tRNA ligase [Candidatus Firestonebacteria bacterium]
MRWSKALIPTLKEIPAEAEIISHKLMLKAGLIRKVASGLYNFLPLGFKVYLKIEKIIREEMDKAGAFEILMPIMTPAELWMETGRWDLYGKDLVKVKDRAGREYALGPTHEEAVTDLARKEIRSYRDLPKNFYQIRNKFRDEIRPRFGVMRCREFIMKDAYSFDRNEESAEESYKIMFEAYKKIFTRCGLDFRPVEADTGNIGGSFSHEFMVLANTGEEVIINCPACGYAANREKAEGIPSFCGKEKEELKPLKKVSTPAQHTVEQVTAFLKKAPSELVKTLLYVADGKPVAALVKGEDELNEHKLKNFLKAAELVMMTEEQVKTATKAPMGFAGPVNLAGMKIFADNAVMKMKNFVIGANEKDMHFINANFERDFKINKFIDLRTAAEGDICVKCGRVLSGLKGIEVGHTFKLGLKYSKAMKAEFLDEDGKRKPMVMGCYGIGVTRIIGAAIEQGNDENGIIWPTAIAPYQAVITALNYNDEKVKALADSLYEGFKTAGVEVLLDDRDVSAGFKFKDAELVGIPFRVTVGNKAVNKGLFEIKVRKTKEEFTMKREEVLSEIQALIGKEPAK